ncbi:TonB-dependent receptor [uncultured Shewanella sp.]|uniref:TonB-dependent receptor n=1 Tax=uncultured Shewanella sp. TaxID=173975 RepID=UPI0026262A6E|nr:TonB-dependent receptor [uncultured Shewanella sp.]
MMKKPHLWPSLCALAVSSVLSPIAFAANNETRLKEEEPLEHISVTGSHIKRTDLEGASPMTVLTDEDIARSGAQDMSQLLSKLPIAGAGTFATQGNDSDDTANGAAAISLRGLGADATLVLLNGRRVAVSSFAKNIDTSFVDINAIPMSAVERVDIVKDGASATYGSDAIAGVVNIILKKDFEGFEINAKAGETVDAGGGQTSASILWGSHAEKSHTSIILNYFHENETTLGDRSYSRSANQTARGGSDSRSSSGNPGSYIPASIGTDGSITTLSDTYDWTPGGNCPDDNNNGTFCVYDYAPMMTSTPETTRVGLSVFHDYYINDDITLFSEMMYQHNESIVHGAASPSFSELYVLSSNPNYSSANNPYAASGEDLTMRRRITETGGRQKEAESDSARLVMGLDGMLGEWDWELAYTYSYNRNYEFGQNGYVWTSVLQDAINDGSFNPFSTTQTTAVLDEISVNTTRNAKSTTSAFDGTIAGEIFELPAGHVGMAIGFEYREEDLSDKPDELFLRGEIFGTEATEAYGSRDQTSVFIEFAVPVFETLEAQLAGRYENYSDFGTTTSPKVALLYTPLNTLTFRASWAEGFRAPSLVQLGLGASQESPELIDTQRCAYTNADEDCTAQERTVNFSGNPDLKAEESTSYNLGGVWEVIDNLSMGIDYWYYKVDGLIDADPQYVINTQGNNSDVVQREAPSGGIPGRIISISDQFANLNEQTTDGIDFDVQYMFDTGEYGEFGLSYNLTWVHEFEQVRADGSVVELKGRYEHPEYRWTGGLNWAMSNWQATTRLNYISEVAYTLEQNTEGYIDAMTTVDLNVTYLGFDHWSLTMGANNVFNEEPPFSKVDFMGYDQNTYSAIGAFWYASATYRF